MKFDFTKEPGKKLEKELYDNSNIEISIVVPYYNDKLYINQTINSLLNQTYPCYEILIINDGSNDTESIQKLEELKKLDKRIKVYNKENEGLAATRDYGVSKSSKSSKYILFLDSDDLIEKTYLECAYWTLETNKSASWAYSDTIGFQSFTYTWNKQFDSNKLKRENILIATALVRKRDFLSVNGYGLKEKSVNEDWNFWLKMLAKKNYPVHMNFYGQWYRRKTLGELANANKNKERTLKIISETKKTVKSKVFAVEYPRYDYNHEEILEYQKTVQTPILKNTKAKNVLISFSTLEKNYNSKIELLKKLKSENYRIICVLTQTSLNNKRQELEEYVAALYDLTTFLNQKDWLSFINYIIKKETIQSIINLDDSFFYITLPYIALTHKNIKVISNFKTKPNLKLYDNIIFIEENFNNIMDVLTKKYKNSPKTRYDKETAKNIIKKYLVSQKDNITNLSKLYCKEAYKNKRGIKNILWNIPIWRKITNTKIWKFTKKLIKRGEYGA